MESELFMNMSGIRAAVTATAAVSLVCTTAFASGVVMDLAMTGLFHLSSLVAIGIGTLILGADGWFGVWLFRRAYAVEKTFESRTGQTEI